MMYRKVFSAFACASALIAAPVPTPAQVVEESVAADVLETVGKWIGGGITSAAIGKAVSAILGGNNDPEILDDLNKIIATQNKILDEIADLEDEVIITALKTELHDPTTNIETAFGQLQTYAKGQIKGDELKKDIDTWANNVVGSWDIAKSMTSINEIALGTLTNNEPAAADCTKASSPGLFQEAYSKNVDEVRKQLAKRRYIDVYRILRGYLSQVFNLQYKGVVVQVNAHMHLKEPETAMVALKAMQTNLDAQLKCVQTLTPDSLRYLAAFLGKTEQVKVRFKSKRDGKVMYNMHPQADREVATIEMQAAEKTEWETWIFERADTSATSFYVRPIDNNVGDVVYGAGALTWWAGASNKEEWLIIPSKNAEDVLIVSKKGKAWVWDGKKKVGPWYNKETIWAVKLTGEKDGELVDEKNTRWTIEYPDDPPKVYP